MGFRSVALVQAHQQIQPVHDYYIADLVELCGLAAMVREEVDQLTIPVGPCERAPLEAFERHLRRHRPELVGISTFTCGAGSAVEYAELARRFGAFVVLGGYHPSALPEEVLAHPSVDAVVRGEGEETFAELVRCGSPEGVAGVSYRDGGRVVHNPSRPPIADLDCLPRPLRELRPSRFGLAGLDYHTETIYASRGCRGRCIFCANHLVGGGWRPRSVDALIEELCTIPPARRGPWKVVKFWDSAFLADPQRVLDLCLGIIDLGLPRHFRFIAETRVEDVVRSAEILPTLRAAGITRIGCGIESPNLETHKDLRKGLNLSHVHKAAELLTAADIHFSKFLIVGHEGENEEDILGYPEYSLAHGARLQSTTFFVMTPYPGTELAERYRQRNLVTSQDWDLYSNFVAVVSPGGIPDRRLQVLHAAVALRYGVFRRYLAGRSLLSAVERAFEPLLLLAAVGLLRGDRTRGEVAASLHDALTAAAGTADRPRRHRRPGDRVALRFVLEGRPPVTIGSRAAGEREELVIGVGIGGIDGRRGQLVLGVSLAGLVDLAARARPRRLTSDLLTLRWRPAAFRLRWLPDLAADVGTVAGAALGALRAPARPARR